MCSDPNNIVDPEDVLGEVMQGMVSGETGQVPATYLAETEAMDIADLIVRSIQSCPKEMWGKLAQNMILTGGVSSTANLITQVEDLVFQKLSKDVDTVEILLINVQQLA